MGLQAYRQRLGLTQQQAAEALGLRSKGYYSRMENGFEPFSIRVALKVEAWTNGEVKAIALLDPEHAALLAAAIARARLPEATPA